MAPNDPQVRSLRGFISLADGKVARARGDFEGLVGAVELIPFEFDVRALAFGADGLVDQRGARLVDVFALWGVVLLLFFVGLEFSFGALLKSRRQ